MLIREKGDIMKALEQTINSLQSATEVIVRIG